MRSKSADYFLDYRDSRTRSVNQLHCDAQILNIPSQVDCIPYITITIASSGEKRAIVRTYSKFFNTLGEIGGTADIFLIFSFLLYFKYNSYFLTKFLRSEVFEAESIKKMKRFFFYQKHKKSAKTHPRQHQSGQADLLPHQIQLQNRISPAGVGSHSYKRSQTSIINEDIMNSKQLNKLVDEQIDESLSGVALFRSLNELKVLRKIFLKPKHRKLLPLVLLNLKQQELLQNQQENQVGPALTNQDLSVDQALEKLNSEEPSSEIEKVINEFIIDNLPLKRAPQGQEKPPPSSQIPDPFKFNLAENQDQFSDLNNPGEGLSRLDSPRLSLKSQGSILRSIPSKIQNDPQKRPKKKMTILGTLKPKTKVSKTKTLMTSNSNVQDGRQRSPKRYGHPGEDGQVQMSQLSRKGRSKSRPRFRNMP